jgi:hypothetical protein
MCVVSFRASVTIGQSFDLVQWWFLPLSVLVLLRQAVGRRTVSQKLRRKRSVGQKGFITLMIDQFYFEATESHDFPLAKSSDIIAPLESNSNQMYIGSRWETVALFRCGSKKFFFFEQSRINIVIKSGLTIKIVEFFFLPWKTVCCHEEIVDLPSSIGDLSIKKGQTRGFLASKIGFHQWWSKLWVSTTRKNRFLPGKHDIFPSTNRILSAPGGLDAQQLVS